MTKAGEEPGNEARYLLEGSHHEQNVGKDLLGGQKMVDVGPGVLLAGVALAASQYGREVRGIPAP